MCGLDPLSRKNFDHRRDWIEHRLADLAEIFAVSIWSYAVMSNHVHAVIEIRAEAAQAWSADVVALRWLRLYPSKAESAERAAEVLAGSTARIEVLRKRLCSLSWFMKSLNEPIARRANAEDECTGRFWEGRFTSQPLLDEAAVMSAMTYVDLNPIRAGITDTLEGSRHTSVVKRIEALAATQAAVGESEVQKLGPTPQDLRSTEKPSERSAPIGQHASTLQGQMTAPAIEPGAPEDARTAPLTAVLGLTGSLVAAISTREYIELVDLAGRDWHPRKRGRISGPPPAVLAKLGIAPDRWIDHVKAVKPKAGFWRAIGGEEALTAKAAAMGQHWLRGLNVARSLQS